MLLRHVAQGDTPPLVAPFAVEHRKAMVIDPPLLPILAHDAEGDVGFIVVTPGQLSIGMTRPDIGSTALSTKFLSNTFLAVLADNVAEA